MGIIDSLFRKTKNPDIEFTNPDLVQAMNEIASNDNPDNRKRLYNALLVSMLWIPVPEVPRELRPGLNTTKAAVQLQVTGITDSNGIRLAPAFTDSEALRTWDPNTPHLAIKAQDLFRFVVETNLQGIIINPFDPIRKMIRPGGRINRDEVDLLAKGVVPIRAGPNLVQFQFRGNQKVAVGRPAHPPSMTVEQLLSAAAFDLPEIAELYIFQMTIQAGLSSAVVGINLGSAASKGRQDEIANIMGRAVRAELKTGESLDFMFLNGSLREQVRNIGKAIYRRS